MVLRGVWLPSLSVDFALRLDALALPFVLNVLAVSLLAVSYAWGYWRADGRSHLSYALLLGFVGSMLGTLLADDVFLFFVFWEAMLVVSSLLLAGWGEGDRVGQVTLKYFLYTHAGSLLVLTALIMLTAETGSSSMEAIRTGLPQLSLAQLNWLAVLLLVGFSVKLAVFPLHTWLPDAHTVAPMPVTIMLAAAMLSMGAYGILRFCFPVWQVAQATWLQLPILVLALASQVYGGLMCLASRDIKRLVAYSSVSQMGYVLFGLASWLPHGVAGAIYHIISHGLLKTLLFMGVGLILRSAGRRPIDELGGLRRLMPATAAGMGVGAIAIAGSPPFVAFHGEWLIFSAGLSSAYPALGYLALLAPLLTAAYAVWFVLRLAFNPVPVGLQCRQSHPAMRWSFYVVAALTLILGLYPAPIYRWVDAAAKLVLVGP